MWWEREEVQVLWNDPRAVFIVSLKTQLKQHLTCLIHSVGAQTLRKGCAFAMPWLYDLKSRSCPCLVFNNQEIAAQSTIQKLVMAMLGVCCHHRHQTLHQFLSWASICSDPGTVRGASIYCGLGCVEGRGKPGQEDCQWAVSKKNEKDFWVPVEKLLGWNEESEVQELLIRVLKVDEKSKAWVMQEKEES